MRSLHDEIMKIPVGGKGVSIAREALTDSGGVHIAYKIGHRDARHAAAELANKYDDNHERLVKMLKLVMASNQDFIECEKSEELGMPDIDWSENIQQEARTLLAALEAEKGGEL